MKKKSASPTTTIIAVIVVVLLIGAGAFALFKKANKQNTAQVQGAQTSDSQLVTEKADLNRAFEIKALDTQGKQAKSKITMNIKSIEKTNEILVKGNPATAKGNSRFLVLNIELSNSSLERLIVAPLDIVRLIINEQKRAAEIYTEELTQIKGSVVVEPDSTKVTRVGFVLNEDIVNESKSLQVGEIDSERKELVEISL